MKTLEVIINGKVVQLTEQIRPVIEKVVSEFRNPLKKTGSYSYTLKFPVTQTNKLIFDFQSDLQVIGKFRKTYSCTVLVNSIEVLSGEFVLNKISKTGFEGFVSGLKGERLGDIIDEKKVLTEIKSFTPIDFEGDTTVWEYLDQDLNATNSEICFPYLPDSFYRLRDHNSMNWQLLSELELGYEQFGVSHFTASVFKNIFTDAGYTLTGNVLTGDTFNRMVMLYSNDGSEPKYNYAALNPLSAFGTIPMSHNQTSDDQLSDWYYFIVEPQYKDIYDAFGVLTNAKTGDKSFSLGSDGVYTCKYTADYTISYKTEAKVRKTSNGDERWCKWFASFREIDDNQNPDSIYYNSSYAGLNMSHFTDSETIITGATVTNQTVRLQAGKQYRVQIYLAVLKDQDLENTFIDIPVANNWFTISAVSGRELLNPADFLPNLKQIDFVQALFKIFNLYYQINTQTKEVNLFTRDEFFELNKTNILDISKNVDLSQAEETPLDTQDFAATYYRYAQDESDYILNRTNYLELVNGDVPDEAYELPFAPLSFVKYEVIADDLTTTGVDFMAVALPDTDIADASILQDTDLTSNFSYKPKLALYQGADVINTGFYVGNYAYSVTMNRTRGLISDNVFGTVGGFLGSTPINIYYKYFPKLTFFNVLDQPVYEIKTNTLTREFSLVPYTGSTIYSTANSTFVNSGSTALTITKLDKTSIALTGTKSEFQKLYKNDLLITNFSNYFQTEIKINPVLYSQLNGRNILKVENDLYLLESIQQYDLTGDQAKIKVYKLVSG